MTTAQIADIGFLVAAFVVPVLLVWRWKQRGVFLGAGFAWLVLIAAGYVLAALDPAREGGLVDGIWLLFGWVGTLAYSGLVYLAIRIIEAVWTRRPGRSRSAARSAAGPG